MITSSVTVTDEDFYFCAEQKINKSALLRRAIEEEKQRCGYVRGATIKEMNTRLEIFRRRNEMLTEKLEEFAPKLLDDVNEQLNKEQRKCLELKR